MRVIQQFTQERLHPGCYLGVSVTWKQREMQGKKSGIKTIIRNLNVLDCSGTHTFIVSRGRCFFAQCGPKVPGL